MHAKCAIVARSDGQPDVSNGVLLCPAHHHALHQGAFQLKMIDGLPWIRHKPDFHDDNAWQPAGHDRLLSAVFSA